MVGGFVKTPANSCCCCFPQRMGLKIAVFLAFLGAQIGIVQTYGMFVLYETPTEEDALLLPEGHPIYTDKLSAAMAGFGPDLCLFIILLFRLV